jgi:hypothetical protein
MRRIAVFLSLSIAVGAPLAAVDEAEDELKSATLLAFVRNAHWEEGPGGNTALTIGVVGRTDFFRLLRIRFDGKTVDGRPLRAVQVNGPAEPGCCQVVYFATDKPGEIKPVLQALNVSHVLTIGETDGFLDQGGAVNLFLQDGHMSFEVSLPALNRAGVEISSKLLRFGQIRGRSKGKVVP